MFPVVSFVGEMGQADGPSRQGMGEMNISSRKAELAEKILNSVKAENLGFKDRQLFPAINQLIETYGLDDAFQWITKDNFAVLVTYMLESSPKMSEKPSSSPLSGKKVQRMLNTDGVAVVRRSENATELRSGPLATEETDGRKKQHHERHWPTDGATKSKKAKITSIYSDDEFRAVPTSQFLEPVAADSVSPSAKVHKVKVPVPSLPSFGEMHKGVSPHCSLSPPMKEREAKRSRSEHSESRASEKHLSPTSVVHSRNIDHHRVLTGDRKETNQKTTMSPEKFKATPKERSIEKVEVHNEPGQDNRKWSRDSPMKEREGRRSRSAHSENNALEKHISPTVTHGKHIINIDDHKNVLSSDRRDFMKKKTPSTEKPKGTVMEHFRRKVEDQNDLGQDRKVRPRDSDEQKNVGNTENVKEDNKSGPRGRMQVVSQKKIIPSKQLASALREDHPQKADARERVQGKFSNAKSNDNIRPCLKKVKKKSASLSEHIIPRQETKIMSDPLKVREAVCVQKELITPNYCVPVCSNLLWKLKTVAAGSLKTEMDPNAFQFLLARKEDLEQRSDKAVVLPNLDFGEDRNLIQKGASKSGQIVEDKKENPAASADGDGIILSLDISRGREKRRIMCVNEYDDTCFPDNFLYITNSVITDAAHVDQSLSRIGDMHCSCSGNCLLSSTPCKCTGDTRGEYAYDNNGLLIPRLAYNYCSLDGRKNRTDFITECNVSCPCDFLKCGNRVVQRGLKYRLQVFMTKEGKGWGVRSLEPIAARSFLFEYIGEIMTNSEQYYRNIEYREKNIHTYTMLLDADYDMEINHFKDGLNDDEALTLDATRYGNVSRFVNHRCGDPNLLLRPVQIDTRDTHYYHVAFFASRDIAKNEELTWDYNINFDDKHEVRGFRCLCGSSLCRDKKNKVQKKCSLVRD